MAKPIEPTPTLYGEDAQAVINEIDAPMYSKDKEKFLKDCKEAYERTK